MKKLSSYQKLKKNNAELTQDIRILVENKDFIKSAMVKVKYKMLIDMGDSVMSGTRTHADVSNGLSALVNNPLNQFSRARQNIHAEKYTEIKPIDTTLSPELKRNIDFIKEIPKKLFNMLGVNKKHLGT